MNPELPLDTNAPNAGRAVSPLGTLTLLLASILAGFAGWALGERTREYAQVPLEISSKAYQFAELNAATVRVNSVNGSIVYGGWGLALALGLILATAIAFRSDRLRPLPVFFGLACAVALSSLPAFAMMPLHAVSSDQDPGSLDLTMPLLVHLGLWCPIGAGCGLLFGLARGGSKSTIAQSIVAGTIGAAIGTVTFEFLGAILMPTEKTTEPIPGSAKARLTAAMCVTVAIALVLVRSTFGSKAGRPNSSPADRPDGEQVG